MMEDFYFDTSIWLDYYEKRGRNGEVALKLIEKIVEENSIILYSDVIVRELKGLRYSQEEIYDMFRITKPKNLKKVHVYEKQNEEAKKLTSQRDLPKGDAIHAILARDNNAQLISRDSDFNSLRDISKARLPEDFI